MDISFNFLNYCTIYESKGSIRKQKSKEPCFSRIFRSDKSFLTNTYTLYMYRTPKPLQERNANNYCPFEKTEIVKVLRAIKKIASFSYKIKKTDTNYILNISLKGTLEIHKFILSYLRYLYEFPFNMFLMDSLKLTKIKEFKWLSLINIYNIVAETNNINDRGESIHGIGNPDFIKELTSNTYIKKQLNIIGTRMNDLFPQLYKEIKFRYNTDDDIRYLDYWEDSNKFLSRLKIYKKNLQLIKK